MSEKSANSSSLPVPASVAPTRKPALPDFQQRYELLVASISDYAIYMLDSEGYVSSWNAGAERFKGYKAHEIMGQHFSRFYTEEDKEAALPERALNAARNDGRFEGEGWRVRNDGTRFWASVVIDPIRNADGELVGFAKITRDITDRRDAQEALRQSEQHFRLLVQGVTDYAIYMLSPQGEITNWNVGAQRIKGYSQEEVLGSHFSRFFTDEDRAAGVPQRALETAAREGRFESEGWRVRRDGTRFFAHAVLDAIHDEQGTLIGFAKITRDVTEQRATAESLEQTRNALFQAQKMEAIGQLTGGVAHDFNNLLAVLSSGVDILHAQNPGTTTVRVLDSMRRAIDRGALLTQQLLSFARQQPLSTALHQANALIGSFEQVLRRASGPQVSFIFDLAPRLPSIVVDEARFEATLLNLVVNARDAMPGGGSLALETRNVRLREHEVGTLPAGDYVRVTVRDSGTGMTPEVVNRAFEPFFTTKPVGKGTGLGLSQVYGFITQSGGDVQIRTELGKGTAITLFLPAHENAAEVDGGPQAHAERVLIVEDDQLVMAVACDLFETMGYQVQSAPDGVAALRLLEQRGMDMAVDVLFTDLMMPNGMTGLELARTVRERWPQIKIIIASGYPQQALHGEPADLSGFDFVGKPYRLSDLARHLRAPG
ncbi:hybrid sensor histidine kinase/response regulator [Pseudoduganella umbonata]|uniref:histidine kinase n=1 Tax=Pseudoduganella umbonata TaxID=864828 RepID=A0A4P8HXB2_9BURK|nr:PAS domain-containing sensor histidine kinase [Pseudoduganella umbonata]MBB3223053.1 PAS domain S-box-containing protein [Pseudoduganella umbonata]QCP13154.1 PAS domain S-box protein [Pseudoduganella umbonata]